RAGRCVTRAWRTRDGSTAWRSCTHTSVCFITECQNDGISGLVMAHGIHVESVMCSCEGRIEASTLAAIRVKRHQVRCPIGAVCANERSYGSVRGVLGDRYPYRDRLRPFPHGSALANPSWQSMFPDHEA